MKPHLIVPLIGIVLVIIIVLTYEYAQSAAYTCILQGYWEAPQQFCEQAGLSAAHIYISGNSMYVFLDTPTGPVINDVLNARFQSKPAIPGQEYREWDISLSESAGPLPDRFRARFEPSGGMLGFYQDDVLYMELYKDSKATSGVV